MQDKNLTSELNFLRQKIDDCNQELIDVLSRRFAYTRTIGEIKACLGLPPLDVKREEQILNMVADLSAKKGLNRDFMFDLFQRLMAQVRQEHLGQRHA